MIVFLNNLYYLALDASFWLVIGLFIGGLFKTLIPTEFLNRHLSQPGFSSIIKAAILGAPLPLCSCGVIPAAMGLREAGASKPATTSFLVSTPETGVDSVFITYAMMGPFMAVARPIIAIVSAITAGTLVSLFDSETDDVVAEKVESSCCASKNKPVAPKTTSCCSSESQEETVEEHEHQEETSCCSKEETTIEQSLLDKVIGGVKYAFTDLLDNIIFWLVIGITFAAVVETFVPSDMLIKYGTGWTGMLVMLVVGIPMYVCATASTPLAAGFLLAGISPGAVIVFLLAGPATNMATLGIIQQQMGKRTMFLYLTAIMTVALISGYVVDALVVLWNIDIFEHLSVNHGHIPEFLQIIALLLLFVMSVRKYFNFNKSVSIIGD
ncbi:MAG: SO_0444 family Cu/Zn efflux transporter [Proteobacteria bacterium]|nr:SO_0444 family Cu/Zn efflux transporter [Pseudomonadota bacterium]